MQHMLVFLIRSVTKIFSITLGLISQCLDFLDVLRSYFYYEQGHFVPISAYNSHFRAHAKNGFSGFVDGVKRDLDAGAGVNHGS